MAVVVSVCWLRKAVAVSTAFGLELERIRGEVENGRV